MESLEVIRGTVINHGPNNNFGVLNCAQPVALRAQRDDDQLRHRLHPPGRQVRGIISEDDEGSRQVGTDISARWHVHTRQSVDNVGLVASYTGADVQGNWDTERLRFNDFYGALGWKGRPPTS